MIDDDTIYREFNPVLDRINQLRTNFADLYKWAKGNTNDAKDKRRIAEALTDVVVEAEEVAEEFKKVVRQYDSETQQYDPDEET